MAAHILLGDDDQELAEVIGWYLQAEGFQVTVAADGAALQAVMDQDPPQVAVLRASLPGLETPDLVAALRALGPVLLLSGEGGAVPAGLEDQCAVTGPCGPMELVERIRALVRQARVRERVQATAAGLEVRVAEREVLVQGQPVALTAAEFDLLLILMRQPQVALTRSQIADHLWGEDYYGDLRLVDSHVSHLRRKLTAAGLKRGPIATARGVGYVFRPEA